MLTDAMPAWHFGHFVMQGSFVKVSGVEAFTVAKESRHPAVRPCIDHVTPMSARTSPRRIVGSRIRRRLRGGTHYGLGSPRAMRWKMAMSMRRTAFLAQ